MQSGKLKDGEPVPVSARSRFLAGRARVPFDGEIRLK